jgi:hypothetical protein
LAPGILFGTALFLAALDIAFVIALSAVILGLPGSGAAFLPGIASFTPLFTLLGRIGGLRHPLHASSDDQHCQSHTVVLAIHDFSPFIDRSGRSTKNSAKACINILRSALKNTV